MSNIMHARVFHKGEWKTVKVAIDVDWNYLAEDLASKALRNKSGKTALAVGIKAKIVS